MKPPRIVPSRRAPSARLLRFAPALRVTGRSAPVACSYGRKVTFRPSLPTGIPKETGRLDADLNLNPTGQFICYEHRTG